MLPPHFSCRSLFPSSTPSFAIFSPARVSPPPHPPPPAVIASKRGPPTAAAPKPAKVCSSLSVPTAPEPTAPHSVASYSYTSALSHYRCRHQRGGVLRDIRHSPSVSVLGAGGRGVGAGERGTKGFIIIVFQLL